MAFSDINFLRPYNDGDRVVQIYDDKGILLYTLNPYSITNTQVRNNLINISTKSGRVITLDFLNHQISKNALPLLQVRLDLLRDIPPLNPDKETGNYVQEQLVSKVDLQAPAESGYLAQWVGDTVLSVSSLYEADGKLSLGTTAGIYDFNIIGTLSSSDIIANNVYAENLIYKVDGESGYLAQWVGDNSISISNLYEANGKLNLGTTAGIYDFNIVGTLSSSDIIADNLHVDEIITLPEGRHLYSGGLRFSSRITGTSQDLLTVLDRGFYFELTTQKYLSFERGITVIISNGLEDFYVDDDYYDDATAAVMFAIVDSYTESTGVLGLYVETTIGLGRTASSWSINMSGRQAALELGPTASFEELTVTGTSNLQQVISTTASFEDLTVNGPTNIQQVVETLTTATAVIAGSPSTFNLNFDDGSIFYIEPEGDNFVANYSNVPVTDNRIISTTIIISQTASAYIPNVVYINGDIIPISWSSGSLPTGNANQTDIVGFSFMRIGATWSKVFGQLSTFATL